jgi:hypothetical protein
MKFTRKKLSPDMEQQVSNFTQQQVQQQLQAQQQVQQQLQAQQQQVQQQQVQQQQAQQQQVQQPIYQQSQIQTYQQPLYQTQAQIQTYQQPLGQQTSYPQSSIFQPPQQLQMYQQPQNIYQQNYQQPQNIYQQNAQTGMTTRSPQENQKILVTIMTAQSFRVKCRICHTILENKGDFKKCKCGKISIDGGKNTNSRRLIGSLDDIDLA